VNYLNCILGIFSLLFWISKFQLVSEWSETLRCRVIPLSICGIVKCHMNAFRISKSIYWENNVATPDQTFKHCFDWKKVIHVNFTPKSHHNY